MSQLLFPTPDHQVLPQAQVQDHGEGHEIGSATEPITKEDKILRSIISGTIGLLIGVVQAIIVSNSLVEIANTKAFSIVFGISLLLLAIVLAWRIWVAHSGSPISKYSLLALALFVAICGILCFVVDSKRVSSLSKTKKAPYFALIGMALSFALTFAFTEFINIGICSLCCPRTFSVHPPFASRVQLYIILTMGLFLGMLLGIIFGALDAEDDFSANHTQLVKSLLYGLIPGSILGITVGVGSELMRDKLPANAYAPLPSESEGTAPETSHRSMPSGYDDI